MPFPARRSRSPSPFRRARRIAFSLSDAAAAKALAALFGAEVSVVAHDVKRLFLAADILGIAPPARFFDTMLASYVVAPGLHAHDLAGDARALLDLPPEAVPPVKDVAGKEGLSSPERSRPRPGCRTSRRARASLSRSPMRSLRSSTPLRP